MGMPTRRQGLALMALTAAGVAAPVAAAGRRVALISLLGDELVIVYAVAVTGSKLDRNRQRPLADPGRTFDRFALLAASQAISRRVPDTAAVALDVGRTVLHQQPELLSDGGSIALPDNVVSALEQAGADQVLLMSKHRAPTAIRLLDTTVGVGWLRGLGYYIDGQIQLIVRDSGESGAGMLVPYVYLKLTLADVRSGRILREQVVTASRSYAAAASPDASDPWDVLRPEEKVGRLRDLMTSELATAVPAVMA